MKTALAATIALALACMIALTSAQVTIALAKRPAAGAQASESALERKKTEVEIRKAQAEASKTESDDGTLWRIAPYLAPLATALIAGIGIYLTAKKAGEDRLDAIDKEGREREGTEAAAEIVRFDERFATAVTGLSSEKPGEQQGAAVLVASMVRERRESLSDQALQLLLVALQSTHDEACEQILVLALERFAHAAPTRLIATDHGKPIFGLARTKAANLDLSQLPLPGLDIAFASLRGADFRGADLHGCRALDADLRDSRFARANLREAEWNRVKATRARFQQATLDSAGLFEANLTKANFHRADLTDANLRHSTLNGADFRNAQLAGANFYSAGLDDSALRSILESPDWEAATFDSDTETRLLTLKAALEA